jgi:predicted membrane GTPase involved in stress response
MKTGEDVAIAKRDGSFHKTKITKLFSFSGLKRTDITETSLGDIIAVAGVEGITIGETITDAENPSPLPPIIIDEPTIGMLFTIISSRLAICASGSIKNCSPMSRCAWKRQAAPIRSKFWDAVSCSFRFLSR